MSWFNSEFITSAIKRIFRLKKFANVEFSAKQAFEDFDIAMLLMQAFLALAIVALLLGGVFWIISFLRRRALYRAKTLLVLLAAQISLLLHAEKLPEDQRLALDRGRKETLSLLINCLTTRKVEKIFGERQSSLILLALNYMLKSEATETILSQQLLMINQLQEILSAQQR